MDFLRSFLEKPKATDKNKNKISLTIKYIDNSLEAVKERIDSARIKGIQRHLENINAILTEEWGGQDGLNYTPHERRRIEFYDLQMKADLTKVKFEILEDETFPMGF